MATKTKMAKTEDELMQLTLQIRNRKDADKQYAKFHGDSLLGDQIRVQEGFWSDFRNVYSVPRNWPAFGNIIEVKLKNLLYGTNKTPDARDLAQIAGSFSDYSIKRQGMIDGQVKAKYDRMLHPPVTYLGDAFQYRTVDGKFNSVLHPHLGQAGAPYAKTVPSKTAPLGALPAPEDLFDKLMARQPNGRPSESGLSSMLIYHATIIIHDIFRTNDNDKNISDSSSYLDLSPLYGYTPEMQAAVRDDRYKLGFLKPDTFAEDRLLRQPPGVCIMLVIYNRYHNYAAAQLRRINENGRFSVPRKYADVKLVATARSFFETPDNLEKVTAKERATFAEKCDAYTQAWHDYRASHAWEERDGVDSLDVAHALEAYIPAKDDDKAKRKTFEELYEAAWQKLDDDLFNTARLITCGMYIQVAIHDYLRALMGFHNYDTNFTLDPRTDFDQRQTSRGLGNQVTVEFNVLYRFHCAISRKDEKYTEDYMHYSDLDISDPPNVSLPEFLLAAKSVRQKAIEQEPKPEVWQRTFGILPSDKYKTDPKATGQHFARNPTTGLFDDQQMMDALTAAMDNPISNFGPRNVPKCLKPVEIMGILQARKWEIGTLNDFREFFGMDRHKTFESITDNVEIQNALRDLYEHPDKVELYPGAFCESDEYMGLDPGPSKHNYALWVAIFSDAITLVRSDRFYTVDWNTNSLTSWGMNQVTPDNEINKSSVFHRLLQRAFPGWYAYDSVRFFHPFYTAQKNAELAVAQGYSQGFKISRTPDQQNATTGKLQYNVDGSNPTKPPKPVYLHDYDKIAAILDDKAGDFIHPALQNEADLPKKAYELLNTDPRPKTLDVYEGVGPKKLEEVTVYLNELMRSIVKRESVAMTNSQFQIDATRDFAIPVVTRYVADFLGFGQLIRTEKDLSGRYSENEIYQHITNIQTFLSYTVDETKLLQRRKAFKASFEFLVSLTADANIADANAWGFTKALFPSSSSNPMKELGFSTAEKIVKSNRDPEKAAAILLFVGLDFAFNSVVAFTSVLDKWFTELYEVANGRKAGEPKWMEVQSLAFKEGEDAEQELNKIIRTEARLAVRLPIVRVALKKRKFTTGPKDKEQTWTVKEKQRVILDITEATATVLKTKEDKDHKPTLQQTKAPATVPKTKEDKDLRSLLHHSSFVERFEAYHPKHVANRALISMVTFFARMRNPRRGADAQGHLKKIKFDWTAEGYSNFMAPGRVLRIEQKVKKLSPEEAAKVYTDKVLRPAIDGYLTTSWDELVPFPNTWKVRYEGFGKSDYQDHKHPEKGPYGKLQQMRLPDDAPPWYQPQGLSHVGGTFAEVACVCANPKTPCLCKEMAAKPEVKSDDGSKPSSDQTPAAKMPTHAGGCKLP